LIPLKQVYEELGLLTKFIENYINRIEETTKGQNLSLSLQGVVELRDVKEIILDCIEPKLK